MISRAKAYMILPTLAIGIGAGWGIAWWLNQPWLEFHDVTSTYTRGSKVVKVTGMYSSTKECSRKEENTRRGAPDPLVWRQEVEGTGAEVVYYGPRPRAPELKIGTHSFAIEIPMTEGIEPDGWKVAVLVSCGSEPLAIRSNSVPVVFIGPEAN